MAEDTIATETAPPVQEESGTITTNSQPESQSAIPQEQPPDPPASAEGEADASSSEELFRTVCISNLSDSLKEDQLRDLFKACGEIEILCIKLKLGEGRVCYIRFNNNDSAQTALLLNDQTLDSKPLQIKLINDSILANYKETNNNNNNNTPTNDNNNDNNNTNHINNNNNNNQIDQQQSALETVHSMSTAKKPATNGSITLPNGILATDALTRGAEEEERQEKLSRTIYVGNLNPMIQQEHLSEFFSVCGTVNLVKIAGNSTNPQAARYGFVEFSSLESARSAYNLSGHFLLDRPIKIGPAKNAILNPHPSKAHIITNPVKINHAMAKVRLLQQRISNRYVSKSKSRSPSLRQKDRRKRSRSRDRERRKRSMSRERERDRSRSRRKRHGDRDRENDKRRDRDRVDKKKKKKDKDESEIKVDKSISKRNEKDKKDKKKERDKKSVSKNRYRDRSRDRDRDGHGHRDRYSHRYNRYYSHSRSPSPSYDKYKRRRRDKSGSRTRSRTRSRDRDRKKSRDSKDKKHKSKDIKEHKKDKKSEKLEKKMELNENNKQIIENNNQKDEIKDESVANTNAKGNMLWDGFQWHPAPNINVSDYRQSKYPPHLLHNKQGMLNVNSPNIQQAAALAACGTKLNTKYPPNPMNACPLVNPEIAAACAAAAAAAGKLTPQQATILKLATVNKAALLGTAKGNESNTNQQQSSSIMAHQLSTNAVQQQMNKFFPSLINKNDS